MQWQKKKKIGVPILTSCTHVKKRATNTHAICVDGWPFNKKSAITKQVKAKIWNKKTQNL